MSNPYFKFKKFTIFHDQCAMKVGTDGVLLGSWTNVNGNPKTIIDIGSGTGLIALMLAQRCKTATIKAIEVEEKCALQCQSNVLASPFGERIVTHNQTIQNFSSTQTQTFDLIVSNPPFFIDSFNSDDTQRNIARHTDTLSQHDLWRSVTVLSHTNSLFSVILPLTEGELFLKKGKEYLWYLSKKCLVKGCEGAKAKRVLYEFSRNKTELVESELTIEKQRGFYTKEFTALVKDFYLHL